MGGGGATMWFDEKHEPQKKEWVVTDTPAVSM